MIRKSRSIPTLLLLAMLAVFAVGAVGCGEDKKPAPSDTGMGAGAVVNVALAEFTLKPDVASVSAGEVTFKAANNGKLEHELVILRTDLPIDKLPLRKEDASKVDEEGTGVKAIGETPEFGPGATHTKTVSLPAGRYALICNIAGHYKLGQRVEFTVK